MFFCDLIKCMGILTCCSSFDEWEYQLISSLKKNSALLTHVELVMSMCGGNDSTVWQPLRLCWCVELTTNNFCFSNESYFPCGYANVWSFLLCVIMLIWGRTKKNVSIVGCMNDMTLNKIPNWKKHQILCAIYNEKTIAY